MITSRKVKVPKSKSKEVKVPGTFGGDRLNRRVRMQDGKDSEESVTL